MGQMEQGKKLKASDMGATRTILLLPTGRWSCFSSFAPSPQTSKRTEL